MDDNNGASRVRGSWVRGFDIGTENTEGYSSDDNPQT
ncbi:hypothetical protein L915_11149 [Phytophthora nicotianae]|uniref:Uncharacterized protein n=1 Tax=Phytophthora nicotianae TaxID=4792 RepID=W2ISP0_PHYNI|nr:hypothetical protein L915_11149 [Phytophthora nicotianae]ETL37155.1 hypothetical protein L916_11044 [Phytophthora nicotianae]